MGGLGAVSAVLSDRRERVVPHRGMKPPPHQNPVTRRDVATGARTALLSRLGAVIEIVAQPAYTWMFGLATYGLYTVLWALVNLIENITDLGKIGRASCRERVCNLV